MNSNNTFIASKNPNTQFKSIQRYEDLNNEQNKDIKNILINIHSFSVKDSELLADNIKLNEFWEVFLIPYENKIYASLVAKKNSNKKDITDYVRKFIDLKFEMNTIQYINGEHYDFCKKYIEKIFPVIFRSHELLAVYVLHIN